MPQYKLKYLLVCYIMVQTTYLISAEPGRFNFTSGQQQTEIPFYTFNNQVVLSVLVNDKVRLNFLLDSGTPQAIFFDRKLAKELGIGFGRRIQFSGIGNSHIVTAFRARGVKLSLPGVEGDMMGMAILSQDYLDMRRFDIHGIIGYQLFTRFAVKLDYLRRIATLMEPEGYPSEGFRAFDVEIQNSKPYITTKVTLETAPEIPLRLMIDTGGSFGLALVNGSHPGIQPPDTADKTVLGNGLGGELKGYLGTATLNLGKQFDTKSIAIFLDPKEYSRKGRDPGKFGSIGNNLLKDFIIILDYVNSRLMLQRQDETLLTRNID